MVNQNCLSSQRIKISIYQLTQLNMVNTLYLSNLPPRPDSFNKFKDILLSTINPSYRAGDSDSRFSLKDAPNKDRVPCIDDSYQIVEISRYRSRKLKRSCFITFKDTENRDRFIKDFKDKLKVRGRKVQIEVAKHESYAELYFNGELEQLKREVQAKKVNKEVSKGNAIVPATKLNRRLRRARSKLRKKNLDEETIRRLLDGQKRPGQAKSSGNTAEGKGKTNDVKKASAKKVVEIISNPPHNILLVQNLPNDITQGELEELFQSSGFKEVRLVGVRNLCFVEYNSSENATNVINRLGHEYSLKDSIIKIGYAKK